MTAVIIRPDPACEANGLYGWDTRFSSIVPTVADWAFAGADEPSNIGGLANKAQLETAVVLSLYTNLSCPPDHPLAKYADGERGGWWGENLLEEGEEIMGSLLWLLDRSVATEEIRLWARSIVLDCLGWALRRKVAARIEAAVTFIGLNGFFIDISLFGQDGMKIYDHRYESAWRQAAPDAVGAMRV